MTDRCPPWCAICLISRGSYFYQLLKTYSKCLLTSNRKQPLGSPRAASRRHPAAWSTAPGRAQTTECGAWRSQNGAESPPALGPCFPHNRRQGSFSASSHEEGAHFTQRLGTPSLSNTARSTNPAEATPGGAAVPSRKHPPGAQGRRGHTGRVSGWRGTTVHGTEMPRRVGCIATC